MYKHGMSKTEIFKRWERINHRCRNPKIASYPYYGGRGIKVCDEWRNDFVAFHDHVMNLPNAMEDGYSLDRIDNDGDYEHGNVRWADRHLQAINSRISSKNTSGYRGVYYHKKDKKWRAKIKVNGKEIYLGSFDNKLDAAKARDQYIIDNELWEYPLQILTGDKD